MGLAEALDKIGETNIFLRRQLVSNDFPVSTDCLHDLKLSCHPRV